MSQPRITRDWKFVLSFTVNSSGSLEDKPVESPGRPTAARRACAPIALDSISFSRGRLAPDTNNASEISIPEPGSGSCGGARRKTAPPPAELPPGLHLGKKKAAQSQQRTLLLNLPPEQLQELSSSGINSIQVRDIILHDTALSQKRWAFSLLIMKCRKHSSYRMKKFIL
jgi:hypothetical protein